MLNRIALKKRREKMIAVLNRCATAGKGLWWDETVLMQMFSMSRHALVAELRLLRKAGLINGKLSSWRGWCHRRRKNNPPPVEKA